jgi:hypothetical protein
VGSSSRDIGMPGGSALEAGAVWGIDIVASPNASEEDDGSLIGA